MSVLTKEVLDGLTKEVKDIIEKVKQSKDWSIAKVNDLVDLIQIVVTQVEGIVKSIGALTSAEKRQLAIDLIYPYVNLSWIPWGLGILIPVSLVKQGIGYFIDYTITLYNKIYGKIWADKLPK